jgi:hypothetical protein
MTPIDYNNPNDMWRNNGYDPYRGLSDEERMKAGCLQLAGIVGAIIVALLICALFGSCTTTQYVTVPEYHTDTLIQTNLQHDSIYVHDSIMVSQQGDTVRIEKWHTKYVEREVHDTTYISKTDSIPKPYPVIQEVPAKLTWWQQTRLHIANILLWALLIVGIGWIIKKKLLP